MDIQGYEDLELIAHGGFALVYRANQAKTGLPVAIKVLGRQEAGEDERFGRELEALQRMSSHSNVVSIIDWGRASTNAPYMVLEFVGGGSLRDLLADGPITAGDAVWVCERILFALGAAHREGILHRDVKPSNILLGRGEALLADFGIARLAEGSATSVSSLAATIQYTAPEILLGQAHTPQADMFSLGATMYALLSGRSLRDGWSDAMAAAGRSDHHDLSDLPEALRPFVAQMLDPEPERRPHTADEARELLLESGVTPLLSQRVQLHVDTPAPQPVNRRADTGVLDHDPTEYRPRTETDKLPGFAPAATPERWWRRPAMVGSLAIVLLLVSAGGALAMFTGEPGDDSVISTLAPSTASTLPATSTPPAQDELSSETSVTAVAITAATIPSTQTTQAPTIPTTTKPTTTEPTSTLPDSDGDGLPDNADRCPDTERGPVDDIGCSWEQRDDDGDGVRNVEDECPAATPSGERPARRGCALSEIDDDKDLYTADVDCNDNDQSINPGAIEVLGNDIDENCDATVEPFPLCTVVPVTWTPEPLRTWTSTTRDGSDREFGANAILVRASVRTVWDEQRLTIELSMSAEGMGGENTAGWGSRAREEYRARTGERILAISGGGYDLPRNGVSDSVETTDQDHHEPEFLDRSGFVKQWRVVADTDKDDVGNDNGDKDANVRATFRSIILLLEQQDGTCRPN